MTRWLKRLGLMAAALLLCAVIAGWLFLRASLPQTAGVVKIPGLTEDVSVVRDSRGVPTIKAANHHDLYLAMGFVHAQDRLFQMDLQRRVGAGRLSEIFGAAALPTDKLMRTLGLYRHAAASRGAASPEFQEVLDAYAAGINAFLHSGSALPLEFAVLGYRPDDWQPADSLVIGKLLALQLSGNYRLELQRARLAQVLTPPEIDSLFPDYPKDAPVTLHSLAEATSDLPLEALLQLVPGDATPQRASNNWVVDGAHSVTGKPLLANDPHLDFAAPLVWYLARLEAPDHEVTGATTPGAPVVVLGHNKRIAWGYTTTDADVEDLFIEQSNEADPTHYATPDGSAAFEVRREVIPVKGNAPATLVVRTTRHGPVISDVLATPPGVSGRTVLALQASFLNDDDRSVEAQWRVGLAQNWTDWLDALRLFTAPAQNMVFADTDGNIGFTVPGQIPIRKSGDGRMPAPGASGEHDWTGFIPFDSLPRSFNPPVGHLASANNKIVSDDYPYFITRDWDASFRIERIETGLAETPKQSLDSSAQLQADIVSLAAERLLPLMLAAMPRNPRAATAMQMLHDWDHRFDPDQPEPLIFAAWVRVLNKRLFGPRLGSLYGTSWSPSLRVTLAVLRDAPSWCGSAGCAALAGDSLDDALDGLVRHYGENIKGWRWGEAHRATFDHPLFSRIPVLRTIFDRQPPAGGAADTVNAGSFGGAGEDNPFADLHGPGLRAIYDLSDLDRSKFQMALGQSAHILSPHYDDLMAGWTRFAGFEISGNPQGDVLVLKP